MEMRGGGGNDIFCNFEGYHKAVKIWMGKYQWGLGRKRATNAADQAGLE